MKKTCISKGWSLNAPGTNGWISTDLPNDYSITQPRNPGAPGGASNGFFVGGEGTYVKELDIPEEKKHYILDIDGAYMYTRVSLGNFLLAKHPHGYTPFLVDLTPRVKFGETNKLTIRTDDCQPSTRWYTGAGIYRDVYLYEGGDIRIEPWDLWVETPETDLVKAYCIVTSDRKDDVTVRFEIFDADENLVVSDEKKLTADGKTTVTGDIRIADANLWNIEDPYLYTIRATILEGDETLDNEELRFGIRTLSVDAENGLLINGESVKLRGGCIHHDHGVLGAADYPAACRRKVEKLRDAGFNALRIAHNPPSETLMEICDELGIIVMDEAFDCWRLDKGGRNNYHRYFDEWWERDTELMVRRDRRHTSVIAFSIGNEIPESKGDTDGDEWSKRISDKIRSLDPTRLVTSATFQMTGEDVWADNTKGYWKPLDICGYNYIYPRYERDHEQFPERVIWGSETHALHFYDSWHKVLDLPYVIGDFTWTAYDNLGEAGTGNSCWARDGHIPCIQLFGYPWRSCYQGDLDLCGYRRPQSYFREAVWIGGVTALFTTHPEHYGEDFSGTGWHWYDVLDTWTFDDKYIGKPVKCEVYTDADEVEWLINGRSLGRSKAEKAIAYMDIPYEKGELSVISYKDGVEHGRASLHTVGKESAVSVAPETDEITADNRDLCYFDITVVDENGDRVPHAKTRLTCIVEGGELMGIFSGDPANEDQYGSDVCHAFYGRAVAIVKTKTPGKVKVTVGGEGLRAGSAEVTAL